MVVQKKTFSFYLITTILCWSATPAIAKLALAEMDNFQLLFYTTIVGFFSLFLLNLFLGKLRLLKAFTFRDYLTMSGIGFIGIFLYHIFFFGSFMFAPAGQANVLNYLWPVFVIIFAILVLKEKYNYKTILAVILSLFGAAIVISGNNPFVFDNQYIKGYLLASIGAICYGFFSVLGKKYLYDKYLSMLIYFFSAAVIIIPVSLMVSGFVIPKSIVTLTAIMILGGLMNSIIFVFWFKALSLGHTHQIANLIYAVPFLAMIWTYFLNDEQLAESSLIGLGLIVTGIIVQYKNQV